MSSFLVIALVLGAMCLCVGPIMVALLLPAISGASGAAQRMSCSNNLKLIGLAMLNYHDVHRAFPAGYVVDQSGRPAHSWRVALLPFLERKDLFDQYNFDEPWDSPNNMLVAEQMPDVFRCPASPDSGPGSNLTNYVVVLCDAPKNKVPDTLFSANRWLRMSEVRDGTSNTIMVVETSVPVPWTQPDEDLHFATMNFQVNGGVNSISSSHGNGAYVLFADGSVHFLTDELDSQTLRMMLQPADGGVLNYQDW